jgi:superfamily II DNA or RNA helicase
MNIKSNIQDECLKSIGNRKYAGAVLGTGAGKTLLGLKHMSKLYHESISYLVVAPKVSIFNEWKEQAVKFGLEYLLPHIIFTTYLSISKQNIKLYDQVYLDECHNLKFKHGVWLNDYNGPVLGLTGTYPRYKNSESYKVCNTYCPIVFEYNVEEAIEDKMLNDYRIFMHLLQLDSNKNIQGKYGMVSEEDIHKMWDNKINKAQGKELQMARIMRMKAIQSFKTKVIYARRLLNQQMDKTLVFADYADQADRICQHSYHSKNKNSKSNLESFKIGSISKLSSVLQLSEGINIPNLKVGIIMHSYANEKKLRQKIGRFLRLNPNETCTVHILCYDNTVDLKWCKAALQDFDKSKIFKYNGEHKKINII